MIGFRPAGMSGVRFCPREAPVLAASIALGLGIAEPAKPAKTASSAAAVSVTTQPLRGGLRRPRA